MIRPSKLPHSKWILKLILLLIWLDNHAVVVAQWHHSCSSTWRPGLKGNKVNLPGPPCPWRPSSRWASRICSRHGSGDRQLTATPYPSRDTWCIPGPCQLRSEARSCGRPSAWPWSCKACARRPEILGGSGGRSSASGGSGPGPWSGRMTLLRFTVQAEF